MIDAKTIQKVRAEAESTLDFRRQLKDSDTLNQLSPELFAEPNVQTVILALTDPTPLTVKRLVELGFERIVDTVGLSGIVVTTLRYKNLEVQFSNLDWQIWCINPRTDDYFHIPKSIWPRTVGELNQLLMRLEKP